VSTPTLPLPPSPQPSGNGPYMPGDPGNIYNINTGTPTAADQNPNDFSVTVNGKTLPIRIDARLKPSQPVTYQPSPLKGPATPSPFNPATAGGSESIEQKIGSITDWWSNSTQRAQIIEQLYSAGLLSSKKAPSTSEVLNAWALVVQEAALENQGTGGSGPISPENLLAKAAKVGWNSISAALAPSDAGSVGTGNLNNAADATTSSSETIYKSYLDPATIMGAQADAWFRLLGRNPTQGEYNSFLNTVMQYQDQSNTGKFETQTKDPSDKTAATDANGQPIPPATNPDGSPVDPTTVTNSVSQRGIGTRGLQFLAGQSALANPEEGAYQAATTYFNAFIKALSGPASGMQASGPTTTIP
jgi:hypothetical protein